MTISREDLAAAASLGLLQYSQVDPLLIFLLQRDVSAKRAALAASARAATPPHWLRVVLWYTAVFLAVLTVGLFAVVYASQLTPGAGLAALLGTVVLYTGAGIKLASWSRGRGYCRITRVALGAVMASLPLAVLALHQALAA